MSDEPRERRTKRETEDMPEPPGEFLSDDLRDATSRFLDEVKRQVRWRRESDAEPKLGPPERRKP
jgi:hypothetical protein